MEKLMKRVIKYIEESMKNIEMYNNAISDINMKQQNQDITPKRADEMKAELQAKIAERQDTQSIKDMLTQVKEAELKRIEGNQQTVTQDTMNELTLLSQIDDVEYDELYDYAVQHSNSPLVLRRIADIAKANEIPFALPESQEVKLEKILNRISGDVEYITNLISSGGDLKLAKGKLAFLNDGTVESYDKLLADYSGKSNLLKNHTVVQQAKKLTKSNNDKVPVNENNIPNADAVVAKMRLAFADSKLENGEWD